MHERNDSLDSTLALDVRINADVTLRSNSMGSAGSLTAGMFVSSYLVNFDPTGAPAADQFVTGVLRIGPVRYWGSSWAKRRWLSPTPYLVRSAITSRRRPRPGVDAAGVGAGSDFLKISDDRLTLTFKLTTNGAGMQQFRVLTEFANGGDFNGDGVVTGADLTVSEVVDGPQCRR